MRLSVTGFHEQWELMSVPISFPCTPTLHECSHEVTWLSSESPHDDEDVGYPLRLDVMLAGNPA